jgi:peptidoglycan/LPS O-acetylase OafA/YrhL
MLFTVLSTIYDVVMQKLGGQPNKLIKAFSISSNFNNLMKINKSDSIVRCMDGIKVLSATWIMIWHRRMPYRYGGRKFFATVGDEFVFRFAERFAFGIDAFFICSAIAVTLSILRSLEA